MKKVEENYGIPDGYFENFAERISTEIFLRDLKENISGTGFNVPENYFENFNKKINYKISIDIEAVKPNIFYLALKKYAAAAIIILLCSFGIYNLNKQDNNVQNQLAKLSVSELENYLQTNVSNVDMVLIMQNVDNVDIKIDEEIDKKDLENYLNSNLL